MVLVEKCLMIVDIGLILFSGMGLWVLVCSWKRLCSVFSFVVCLFMSLVYLWKMLYWWVWVECCSLNIVFGLNRCGELF